MCMLIYSCYERYYLCYVLIIPKTVTIQSSSCFSYLIRSLPWKWHAWWLCWWTTIFMNHATVMNRPDNKLLELRFSHVQKNMRFRPLAPFIAPHTCCIICISFIFATSYIMIHETWDEIELYGSATHLELQFYLLWEKLMPTLRA